MLERSNQTSGRQLKLLVDDIVAECRTLAKNHIDKWKPINKDWPTMEGCAYLRLSTDKQVAV